MQGIKMNSGFQGDSYNADRITYTCLGTVVRRDDPDGLCRVRAHIPGLMELTPWARPRGGGSSNEGAASVPPIGADVYIDFINGDQRMPVWQRADYGIVGNKSEVFKEHTDPDIHVFGIGPFRIVLDNRQVDGITKTVRAKLVKEINGTEEDIVWIEISNDNSIQIHADSAIGMDAGAIIDIDAPVVQIKKRKVMNASRPIS